MRRLAALLAVLGVLVVGADVGARLAAESLVATRLQEAGALPEQPDVDVGGWSFLLQALDGRYRDVRVVAERVPTPGVDLAGLDVRLRDVEAPLGASLRGELAALPVGALEGSVLVGYGQLAAAGPLRLRVTPAGDDLVRVSGSVEVLGTVVQATAVSRVAVAGTALVVSATRYEVGGRAAPAAVAAALGGRLDLRLGLDRLPYGLRVTGVDVAPDGVRVAVAARDVVVRAGSPGRAAALHGA